jgi:hypothetical protein
VKFFLSSSFWLSGLARTLLLFVRFFLKIKANPIPAQYKCMKYRSFAGFLVFAVLLASCDDGQQIRSSYKPVLPALPGDWSDILGEANWRLEWIGEEGTWHKWEGKQGAEVPSLSLIQGWTTPVLAWPFWPELDLNPGIMRPCGALFPWDTSGEKLVLSWEGGVDAVFWKELAAVERQDTAKDERLPWLFDWPRFREIMEDENISEAVRQDPWVVDWKEAGRKTVESGFDRRRITSMKFTEIEIPLMEGRWSGSSPFAPVQEASPEGSLILEVTATVGSWVSSGGILKCSASGWIYRDW